MLEKDLEDIGLNEKEAKLYIASLELGQSTVQEIAKKAGVNRATSYFVIEALMEMGLMSSFTKGKKQYFLASDPEKLVEIAEQEKDKIVKRTEKIKKILPQLQSHNNKKSDKPVVRYFEGKEGIMTMASEVIKSVSGQMNIAFSEDVLNNFFTEAERKKMREQRLDKSIQAKVIYTFKDGVLESKEKSEIRKVSFDKYPITCDVAVYDDKVRIASFQDRVVGIIIEDKEIARTLKAIMDLAWEAAANQQ